MSEIEQDIHNSSESSNDSDIDKKVEEIVGTTEEKVEEVVEDVKKEIENLTTPLTTTTSTNSPAGSSSTSAKEEEACGCPYSLKGKNFICSSWCEVASILKKNPLYEPAKNIVLWGDLIQTGLLFIIINIVFLLTCCFKYNMLSLTGWIGFAVVASSLLFHILNDLAKKHSNAQFTLDNAITNQLKTLNLHVHEASIEKQTKNIGEVINALLKIVADVCSCRSKYLTAQYAIIFYVMGKIGCCVSLSGLSYLGFLALFILPRLYLEKQDAIDPQIAKVKEVGQELLTKLHSFIPVSHAKKNN